MCIDPYVRKFEQCCEIYCIFIFPKLYKIYNKIVLNILISHYQDRFDNLQNTILSSVILSFSVGRLLVSAVRHLQVHKYIKYMVIFHIDMKLTL